MPPEVKKRAFPQDKNYEVVVVDEWWSLMSDDPEGGRSRVRRVLE